jgi:exosortase
MLCIAPPVLLLFMAKPLPDSIVVRLFWPLQVLAARVSKLALELFNVPVYLSGNIIEIPEMRLLVEEACSGMRSVMALLTLSLIVIYFVPLRWYSKLILVAASVVTAIVINVCRVAMTGLLAHFYDPSTATGFFHTFSGMIVFVVGLPVLYGVGLLLTKAEAKLN